MRFFDRKVMRVSFLEIRSHGSDCGYESAHCTNALIGPPSFIKYAGWHLESKGYLVFFAFDEDERKLFVDPTTP
jgi:hypothetical protein